MPRYASLSIAILSPSLISSTFRFSLTRSLHHCLGRPLGFVRSGFHIVTLFNILPSTLHIYTCHAQLSLLFFITPTISGSLNNSLVLRSSFVHIHCFRYYFFGPKSSLIFFFSNVISFFSFAFVDTHATHVYSIIGQARVLYSLSFVLLDSTFDLNRGIREK